MEQGCHPLLGLGKVLPKDPLELLHSKWLCQTDQVAILKQLHLVRMATHQNCLDPQLVRALRDVIASPVRQLHVCDDQRVRTMREKLERFGFAADAMATMAQIADDAAKHVADKFVIINDEKPCHDSIQTLALPSRARGPARHPQTPPYSFTVHNVPSTFLMEADLYIGHRHRNCSLTHGLDIILQSSQEARDGCKPKVLAMTKRFSALDAMIRDIVTKTQTWSDHVEVLTSATRLVNASGADPCVVVGSLVEGIVTTGGRTRAAGAAR